jgi:ectoine hydroxylase-related dioxygenase (phytanoyl-CoA dioxygenase family)
VIGRVFDMACRGRGPRFGFHSYTIKSVTGRMNCDGLVVVHTVIDALNMTRRDTVAGFGHWFYPECVPASLESERDGNGSLVHEYEAEGAQLNAKIILRAE